MSLYVGQTHFLPIPVLMYSAHECSTASLLRLYFGFQPMPFSFEQSSQKSGTSPFQPLPSSKLFLKTVFTFLLPSESFSITIWAICKTVIVSSDPILNTWNCDS